MHWHLDWTTVHSGHLNRSRWMQTDAFSHCMIYSIFSKVHEMGAKCGCDFHRNCGGQRSLVTDRFDHQNFASHKCLIPVYSHTHLIIHRFGVTTKLCFWKKLIFQFTKYQQKWQMFTFLFQINSVFLTLLNNTHKLLDENTKMKIQLTFFWNQYTCYC